MQHCSACGAGRIGYVVTALERNGTKRFYENNTQHLPSLTVLRAVDGRNTTLVIERLLESGLSFHRLSEGNKRWGKLATFLTKYQALLHQVRTNTPWQITFEEDVGVTSSFCELVRHACQLYLAKPATSIVHLSIYAEVLFTSLQGAKRLLAGMRRQGIWRADDQTLADRTLLYRDPHEERVFVDGGAKKNELGLTPVPWFLHRKTNAGDIIGTRRMTWAEMALLRLLTAPEARSLPNFGNPSGVEAIRETLYESCDAEPCKFPAIKATTGAWWYEVPGRVASALPVPPASTTAARGARWARARQQHHQLLRCSLNATSCRTPVRGGGTNHKRGAGKSSAG